MEIFCFSKPWIPALVFLSLSLDVHLTEGFKCHTCTYAYDPDKPDADMACVNLPGIYTGSQVISCSDYCVTQETYNGQMDRVVAYWRSCTDKPDTGYCRGDPNLLTCLHTCIGDLCNSWVTGQLHKLYGNIRPPAPGNGVGEVGVRPPRVLVGCLWALALALAGQWSFLV